MGDSLTEVVKVGDASPVEDDIPIGGLATDQVNGNMFGRGAGGLIPLAASTKVVGSVDAGGGTGTLRISGQVSCTQAEFDALTPVDDLLYFIAG
ncbi:MAG: hypothetical protein DRP93_05670 [Candidatus Neomarinimicrobiota bacterium]|nr:MAG: hypothetical protein DRP93_05670 [Candidatus Neomarinimicrobiota bacterium]